MAWTNPRSYVTGDLIDDDVLNTHLKDNLNALSTHDHGGAAGDGAAALADLNTTTFSDQDPVPGTPASTKIVVYSEGGVWKYKNSSGTVNILSLEGHTH